jgi:hypothetical protein
MKGLFIQGLNCVSPQCKYETITKQKMKSHNSTHKKKKVLNGILETVIKYSNVKIILKHMN